MKVETKSLQSRNSHVGHSIFMGRPKLEMPEFIDSYVDLFV